MPTRHTEFAKFFANCREFRDTSSRRFVKSLYQPDNSSWTEFVNEHAHPVSVEERDDSDERLPPEHADHSSVTASAVDAEIASGLRDGDPQAWTKLYDAYSLRVWRYVARSIGADTAGVADIVQETLLAAATSARQYNATKGTLWQWLTGIAHHRTARYWREHSRRQQVLQKLHDQISHANTTSGDRQKWPAAAAAPEGPLQQQELADLVRVVLSQLPADYTELLTAKYVDDWSVKEIEQHTGSSGDAIRSKLLRARKEFRTIYERLTREDREL